MMWELAHRHREPTEATRLVIEADTSAEAIEQLRAQLPPEYVILYVRGVDRPAPTSAVTT